MGIKWSNGIGFIDQETGGSRSSSNSYQTYAGNLEQNKAMYNQIMEGYANQQANYLRTTGDINAGYDRLVQQQQGYGDAQRLGLKGQYGQQLGQLQQNMISRGMGNSTVLDSAQQGMGAQLAQSQIGLDDALQNRMLGIQQAQLGYQGQAQQGYAALAGQQFGFQGQLGTVSNSKSDSWSGTHWNV